MHFSDLIPIIMVEAAFEGIDRLVAESELLTIADAKTYLHDIDISLEPSVNILCSAWTLAII